ncbi:MAG: type II toxin-antitoxin system VapC family toxin [Opitutales bacterium]|nr:type II toxin-antitoxin system VapC family toxin [Opitutales bacterium]NRA27603.1 type II toxin-antitoxin system VapC family toxin [Opitutales bacterium]
MIVVDTNVIAYLLIEGDQTDAVVKLRESESDWIAPRLWLDEFLSVLSNSERQGVVSSEVADQTLNLACEMMEGQSYNLPAQRVLSTSRRTGCSAYDSQYVCLAEDLGLKLYTFDKKILTVCPNLAFRP